MSAGKDRRYCLAAVLLGGLALPASAAMPPAESLLPASTRGFFSTPNVRRFGDAWAKTSFSALWNDPAMKEFREAARARLDKGDVLPLVLFGLTPGDLQEATTGEMAVALVHDADASPALVLLLDVTGNAAGADKVLERVGRRLAAAGATPTTETVAGENVAVYSLPEALRVGMMQRCYFLRKGDCLIASSGPREVEAVLKRLGGTPAAALDGVAAFQATTAAADKESPEAHARWFAEPLAFLEAVRTFWGEKPKEKPDLLEVLKKEGFTAIQGIGGAVVLSAGEDELLARVHVYAPGPFQRAARMLAFPNLKVGDPPDWVSRQAARCFCLSADFRQIFDAYATLFDSLYGDGEQGVFDDLVKGTKTDPDGPQVDLRGDMVARLDGPLWLADLRPDKDKRLEWLHGVGLSGDKPFAAALERLLSGDEQVRRLTFGEYGAWEILSADELPKPKKDRKSWSMPASTLTVAHQAWLMAETPDLLPLLARKGPPLAESADYREMNRRLNQEVGPAVCLRGFLRNDEEAGDAWEELRSGARSAGRWEWQVLQKLFVGRGDRDKPPFDMTRLPPFEQVRRHVRTQTGIAGVTGEKGWLLLLVIPRNGSPPGNPERQP